MIRSGKSVRIAYDLVVEGQLVRSIQAAKPLKYVHGKKQIPSGLEKALKGLQVGQRMKIVVPPKEGYGLVNPMSIIEMPKKRFPKKDHIVGKEVRSVKDGTYLAKIVEVRKETLLLNFNHPLAGKRLEYDILVVGIEGELPPSAPGKRGGEA